MRRMSGEPYSAVCDMELSGADLDHIPARNLRVPVVELARVWVTAERRADEVQPYPIRVVNWFMSK